LVDEMEGKEKVRGGERWRKMKRKCMCEVYVSRLVSARRGVCGFGLKKRGREGRHAQDCEGGEGVHPRASGNEQFGKDVNAREANDARMGRQSGR
jgi:hypothetical protein